MNTMLESIYFVIQIITGVALIVGVVIALWQYTQSVRSDKTNLSAMQIQKAIDLSRYYKDNILAPYPAIRYVFEKCGVLPIMESIPMQKMRLFDIHELRSILSHDNIERLKTIEKENNFKKHVIEANSIYRLGLDIFPMRRGNYEKEEIAMDDSIVNEQDIISAFFSDLIMDTLNNIEYFAMHFTHNTADESVLYQSLHQTYLGLMQCLYYFIATTNEGNISEHYYTNASELFRIWCDRKIDQGKRREANAGDGISPGNKVPG